MIEVKYTEPPFSYANWNLKEQLATHESTYPLSVELGIDSYLETIESSHNFYPTAHNLLNQLVYIGHSPGDDWANVTLGIDIALEDHHLLRSQRDFYEYVVDVVTYGYRLVTGDDGKHPVGLNLARLGTNIGMLNGNQFISWSTVGMGLDKDDRWLIPESMLPYDNLKNLPYREYLKSAHWKSKRDQALKNAFYRCQVCNARGYIFEVFKDDPDTTWIHKGDTQLHVHHRIYDRKGCELLQDLTVLCADCHKLFHRYGKLKSYDEMALDRHEKFGIDF